MKKRTSEPAAPCCAVAGVVSIDGRGQIVLPKDVREKAGIAAGDKLAVVTLSCGGETCCVALMKAEGLADAVQRILGPFAGALTGGKGGA